MFTQENVFTFWPKSNQTETEKYYSSARFIVYATLLAFALKRNVKILVLGVVLFVGLYVYSKNKLVSDGHVNSTVSSSNDDPFGNFNYSKGSSDAAVTKWANNTFTSDKRNAERNFYTVPSDDMDTFLDFVHGGKNKPFCRQNQSACTADNNPRSMEYVQQRTNVNSFNL